MGSSPWFLEIASMAAHLTKFGYGSPGHFIIRFPMTGGQPRPRADMFGRFEPGDVSQLGTEGGSVGAIPSRKL